MPKIYKRHCNYCGKIYKGVGKEFCSFSCSSKVKRLGMKHSEQAKEKMRIKKIGIKLSNNHKENIRKSLLGRKISKEWREKISISNQGKKCPWAKPPIHKGKDCHLWRGGISFESYSIDWTETLKKSIRERDRYICQICGKSQIEELENIERKLTVHHIDYNKKNCDPKNLITVCCECHGKTNVNRIYWENKLTN